MNLAHAYSLVKPEDTLDMVLLKAERVANIVKNRQSIAAALGDTDDFAEKEAKSNFSPDQKRLYQFWKMGHEMPEEMVWHNKELQKHFSQHEDDEYGEPAQKRTRLNEKKEESNEIQNMDEFCEKKALGELFKVPSPMMHFINRDDVLHFRKTFNQLCPLLDAMLIIVRTKQGLGSVAQKLTKKRQKREFESTQQVLDALISQKRMIKAKVDTHFEKVDQYAVVIRERMRCYDREIEPNRDYSTKKLETESVVGLVSNSPLILSAPVPQSAAASSNEHMGENGHHTLHNERIGKSGQSAPLDGQHFYEQESMEANGRGADSTNSQSDTIQGVTLAENDFAEVTARAITSLCEVFQSNTKESSIGLPVNPMKRNDEATVPQSSAIQSLTALPQAQTQESPQKGSFDQGQGRDTMVEQTSRNLPNQFDLDSLLPPAMRVNPVSPQNRRVQGNRLEALRQSTQQIQRGEGLERTPTSPQQDPKEREYLPVRSSSSEPARRPLSATYGPFTPPTWLNTFKIPGGKTIIPQTSSPKASNVEQAPQMPRGILKNPLRDITLSAPMPQAQPASITEIDSRNVLSEHGEKDNQASQSSTSPNQSSIKSIVHDKSWPFTTHQTTYF